MTYYTVETHMNVSVADPQVCDVSTLDEAKRAAEERQTSQDTNLEVRNENGVRIAVNLPGAGWTNVGEER